MTTIESKEIRGLTLKILYLLVVFCVVTTAGITGSYYSLKGDNQVLAGQVDVLRAMVLGLDKRLSNIEAIRK